MNADDEPLIVMTKGRCLLNPRARIFAHLKRISLAGVLH